DHVVLYRDSSVPDRAPSVEELIRQALEDTIEQAPVGILLLDRTMRLSMANSRVAEILGYAVGELRNLEGLSVIHPEDRNPSFDRLLSLRRGTQQVVRGEVRFLTKSGAVVWLDALSSRVPEVPRLPLLGLIFTIVDDITERKRLADDRARMLAQEQAARAQA